MDNGESGLILAMGNHRRTSAEEGPHSGPQGGGQALSLSCSIFALYNLVVLLLVTEPEWATKVTLHREFCHLCKPLASQSWAER